MEHNKNIIFINKHLKRENNLMIKHQEKSDEYYFDKKENNNNKMNSQKTSPKILNIFNNKCLTHYTNEKNTERIELINSFNSIKSNIPLKDKNDEFIKQNKYCNSYTTGDDLKKNYNKNTKEKNGAKSKLYETVDIDIKKKMMIFILY
jgi:hypothetical protein